MEFTHRNVGFECSEVNCDRPALCKGLCNAHYLRLRNSRDMNTAIRIQEKGRNCGVEGCYKKHYGNGYCVSHWKKWNRQTVKLKLIEHLGGKCQACGGKFHHAAFDFHHLDPKKKEFTITNKIQNTSFENLLKEASKCMLLCANCHRIEHAGDLI